MKKLNKLQISSEKLMKNEELAVLRGGYGWTYCYRNGAPCGNMPTADCGQAAMEFCNRACPGWTNAGCFER